jgi:hypothetical protein
LAAFGAVFGSGARRTGRGRYVSGERLAARIGTQRGDGIEQLEPVPDCGDAKLLQGLVRQARKDRLVISFSRNAASYFPRPKLRSQTTTSMVAPLLCRCI